jgi:hypothetical protein
MFGLGALENRQYELLPGERHSDDRAFVSICARRPVFESVRRAVEAEPDIEIRSTTGVAGLMAAGAPQNGAGREIALAFEDAVGEDAAARFDAVSAEDRDRLRVWRGEPIHVRDPCDSMALFLRLSAYPAAMKDPDLFRAVARRVNLLDPPDALEKDDELIAGAQRITRETESPRSMGPMHPELLERISQRSGV